MRKFILGTDWWTDCDDAVAIRILARAHKLEKIKITGIGINACMECSVTSLEGFLNQEGIKVPIGIDLAATDFGGNPPYQNNLSKYSSAYSSNLDAEDSVRLYRRILACTNTPIEIIEIGYLQVIANVLESLPDDISEKSGYELVKERVSKIWVMAGKWDEDFGKENNFTRNSRSRTAGHFFCTKCPVPVTFLGWETGFDVITGDNLNKNDILYKVLCDHGSSDGRSSWDPMLVLMALIGDERAAGYDVVCGRASVDGDTGANHFSPDENGLHKYVIKSKENEYYKKLINQMIT